VPAEGAAGPTGPGWVIQLKGYHFHNSYPGKPELNFTNDEGREFIENTFFKALEEGSIQLPDGPSGPDGPTSVDVPIAKLGIQCPVVTTDNPTINVTYYPEAVGDETGSQMMNRMSESGRGAEAGEAADAGPKRWKLRRYDFTIQFYWKPTPRTARQEKPAAAEGETVSVGDAGGPTG
jgi:type IV pilus assembly protein PilM